MLAEKKTSNRGVGKYDLFACVGLSKRVVVANLKSKSNRCVFHEGMTLQEFKRDN